jgi:hypothetical protein
MQAIKAHSRAKKRLQVFLIFSTRCRSASKSGCLIPGNGSRCPFNRDLGMSQIRPGRFGNDDNLLSPVANRTTISLSACSHHKECDIPALLHNWYWVAERPRSETERLQPSGVDVNSQTILPPPLTSRWRGTRLGTGELLTFACLCNMTLQHFNYTGSDVSCNHDSDFRNELQRYQAMWAAIKRVLMKHARRETQLGLCKFREAQIPDATPPGRLNGLKCV